MKKVMIAMVALGAACICQATVITVVDDAEIRSDTPTNNYGAQTTLSALITADPFYRKGYIKFDASGLGTETTVTNISSFTMYFTQAYARDAKFYLITGADADSWDESSITWSNAPGNGPGTTFLNDASYTSTRIGLSGTEAAPGVVEFIWDSEATMQAVISELNNGDRVATIACMRDSTSRLATFASKENSSGHPVIQMDLQTAENVPSFVIAPVVADSEIHSEAPDTNYGAQTTVSALSTEDPFYRKGYMKFDASALGVEMVVTNISSFTMYFTSQYARDAKFYLITGADADSWDESSITWSNAPGNGPGTTFLNDASYTSTYIGLSESAATNLIGFLWDSEAAKQAVVDELNNGDRVATIACMRDSTSRYFVIASKENLSGHPVPQMKLLTAENMAIPPGAATLVDWVPFSSNVVGLVVHTPNMPSRYHPEATVDLVGVGWTNVPHSTNGLAPFVVTNLAYSTADGSNRVIYVETGDATKFFKVIGE